MEKICLDFDTYDDIMFFESLKKGSYGNIVEYSDDTLLKLYHDRHYELRHESVEELQEVHDEELKILEQKLEVLKNTKVSDLYKGVVESKDCVVGVIMTYYKDYQSLYEVINTLNRKEKIKILKKVRNVFNNLIENGCYPLDLSLGNIMIRKRDLDVKIIDLDDLLTQYKFELNEDYMKFENESKNSFNEVVKTILK